MKHIVALLIKYTAITAVLLIILNLVSLKAFQTS